MKILEFAFFALSALLVVGGALCTVLAARPVRAALGLLLAVLGVACCYLMLSAQLLAAIQLMVYAGGVVVLFLFVVMLLGPAATTARDGRTLPSRLLGAIALLLSAAGMLWLTLTAPGTWPAHAGAAPDGFGGISPLGRELFTQRVVPFELTGLLLLVAVVGAMAVARGRHADPTRPPTASEPQGRVP